MGALWQSEPSRTEAPETPPAETPQRKTPRQRRLWWRLIILIVLVVLAIASVPLMGWLGRRAERTVARREAESRTPAGA